MKKVYINGIGCISAQASYEEKFPWELPHPSTENVRYAQEPSHKEMIPPAAARRMSKAIKMGIAASKKALEEAQLNTPDAIITGTGLGCLADSEKFLRAVLDNQEQFLTPTAFIQSTHNTVAGQVALDLGCTGYNFTYVNGSVSLESALLDAQFQLNDPDCNSVLVGGIDETSPYTLMLYELVDFIKPNPVSPTEVFTPVSKGAVWGEGAAFFVLENQPKSSTYATLEGVAIQNTLTPQQLESFIQTTLANQGLRMEEIDLLVLGNNGDIRDEIYYQQAAKLFPASTHIVYKQHSGEFPTASGFGLWTSLKLLKNQQIPEHLRWNQIDKKNYQTVLLYNQYLGQDHSLVILRK